ncbi:hypothetical protein Sjap_001299 [Stephania japonica]|uniref:Exostosin GT47 domain-containing protein n=1 Tax=Stephania japonica TaxID=461633 RepID=A0AAP0PTD3_9MAGN
MGMGMGNFTRQKKRYSIMSYLEMEKTFKYFVYEEGDPPLFHTSTCDSILAIEGIIIGQLEADEKFRTQNQEDAHVFFLPFSFYNMVQYIWERGSHDSSPFYRTINDYINVIAEKYPYWNRSRGADHSMVACHDWNKIDDMQVYECLPEGMFYDEIMKKSKYCFCPSGYEVASPRIVESLYTGCVPVLLKEGYVAPLSDNQSYELSSMHINSYVSHYTGSSPPSQHQRTQGDPPLFYTSTSDGILAIEGIIMGQLEADDKFITQNQEDAHVFFLPFSVYNMVQYIWERGSHDSSPFYRTINDYINIIAEKYPYWNRSRGADHSMVACHDWPSIDVMLPEIPLPYGKMKPLGGPSPSQKTILAFYASGSNHGPIRPILLEHWKNKTDDMQV